MDCKTLTLTKGKICCEQIHVLNLCFSLILPSPYPLGSPMGIPFIYWSSHGLLFLGLVCRWEWVSFGSGQILPYLVPIYRCRLQMLQKWIQFVQPAFGIVGIRIVFAVAIILPPRGQITVNIKDERWTCTCSKPFWIDEALFQWIRDIWSNNIAYRTFFFFPPPRFAPKSQKLPK